MHDDPLAGEVTTSMSVATIYCECAGNPLMQKGDTSNLALSMYGCRALKGSGALSRNASSASLLLESAAPFSLSTGGWSS